MPYLGGTSLARILEGVSAIQPSARRGRHILEALDRAQAGHESIAVGDGPYRRYLEQSSYVQAVCWIAACLADGLQSAHEHGLIHMDVKPSNVLIAADGLPLLLDFHLAHRPISAGELVGDRLGGTPGWMAPEHRAALDAVGRGQTVSSRRGPASRPVRPGTLVAGGARGTGGNPGRNCGPAAAPAQSGRKRWAGGHCSKVCRSQARRSLSDWGRPWRRPAPALERPATA